MNSKARNVTASQLNVAEMEVITASIEVFEIKVCLLLDETGALLLDFCGDSLDVCPFE